MIFMASWLQNSFSQKNTACGYNSSVNFTTIDPCKGMLGGDGLPVVKSGELPRENVGMIIALRIRNIGINIRIHNIIYYIRYDPLDCPNFSSFRITLGFESGTFLSSH